MWSTGFSCLKGGGVEGTKNRDFCRCVFLWAHHVVFDQLLFPLLRSKNTLDMPVPFEPRLSCFHSIWLDNATPPDSSILLSLLPRTSRLQNNVRERVCVYVCVYARV